MKIKEHSSHCHLIPIYYKKILIIAALRNHLIYHSPVLEEDLNFCRAFHRNASNKQLRYCSLDIVVTSLAKINSNATPKQTLKKMKNASPISRVSVGCFCRVMCGGQLNVYS